MTASDRRRRLLSSACRAVEGFRFRPGVPAACESASVSLAVSEYDKDGASVYFFTLQDGGEPSKDLADICLKLSEASAGSGFRLLTNEYGQAEIAELNPESEYLVQVEEGRSVSELRRVTFTEVVHEDLGLALSASSVEDPIQEFSPMGPVRRASLQRDDAGEVTFRLTVNLSHPEWSGARLARVRIEPSMGVPAADAIVGLFEEPGVFDTALGALGLGQLPRVVLAAGCRLSVLPLTPSELLLEAGRDAALHRLQQSLSATSYAESRAALEQAILTVDETAPAAATEVIKEPLRETVPAQASPPAPEILARLTEMTNQLTQLRSSFQQKLTRDEESKQIITTLHSRLRAAEEDLVLKILKPVLLKMLEWHDTLAKEASTQPVAAELLQDLLAMLYTLSVEPFECPDERFNPKEQKAKAIPNDDPARTGIVIERLRPGFRYNGSVILRPEYVSVYKAPASR